MTKKEKLLYFIEENISDQLIKFICLFNDDQTEITLNMLRSEKDEYKKAVNDRFDEDLISISEDSIQRPYTVQ